MQARQRQGGLGLHLTTFPAKALGVTAASQEKAPDARLISCAAPLLLPLQQPPAVASQILEDWKAANSDLLGKPRKLGTGERGHLAPDHAFGLPSMRHGPEPGVDKLIQVKRGCGGL